MDGETSSLFTGTQQKKTGLNDTKLLTVLLENSFDYIYFKDEYSRFIKVNEQAAWALGAKNPKDVIGKSDFDFFPDIAKQTRADEKRIMETGEPQVNVHQKVTFADGSTHWVSMTKVPFYDHQGNIIGIFGISRDITKEKTEGLEREKAQQSYRQLFDTMNSGVAVYEAVDDGNDFIFLDFNKAAERIEGVKKEDLIGKRVTQVFPGVKDFGVFSVFQRVWKTGQPEFYPEAIYKDENDPGSWRESWVYKLFTGEIVSIYDNVTEKKRIELDLKKSEEKYRTIIEGALDGITMFDAQGTILEVNDAYCQMIGYTHEELIGKTWAEIDVLESPQEVLNHIQQIHQHGFDRFETKHQRKDGEILEISVSVKCLDKTSEIYVNFLKDITDKKKTEGELQTVSTNLQRIISASPSAVITIDSKGLITEWNDASQQIFGWKREEVLGRFNPTVPDEMKDMFFQTMKETHVNLKLKTMKKDGTLVDILLSTSPLYDKDGKLQGALGIMTDISKEVEAEEKVKQSEERYRSLFEDSQDWVYICDFKGNFIDANESCLKGMGYSKSEIATLNFTHIIDKKQLLKAYTITKQLKKGIKQKELIEYRVKRHNGTFAYVESMASTLYKDGKPYAVQGIAREITERKRVEQAIKESEEKFRKFFEHSNIGMAIVSPEGEFLDVNKAMTELLGFSSEEMKEKTFLDITNPEDIQVSKDNYMKLANGEIEFYTLDKRYIHKDGHQIDGLLNISCVRDENGQIVFSIAQLQDKSKEKNALNQLKTSEEKYRTYINHAPDGILIADANGHCLDANPAFCQLTGYSMQEIHTKTIKDLIPQDAFQEAFSHFSKVKNEGQASSILQYQRKDGSLGYWSVAAVKLTDDKILGFVKDVTEMKEAENKILEMNQELEKKVEERTEQINKLLLQKDEFINQLGHDLKNPIGPLLNLLPLLERQEQDEKRREMITVMLRNVGYMKNLVIKTIELAKLNSPNTKFHLEHIDITDAIQNVLDANLLLFKEKEIQIENNISQPPPVQADILRIQEVLNNLLNNAVKFNHHQGTITLNAQDNQDFLTISITDSGIGMTPDQIDHIFDEFYKADQSRHDFDSSGLGMPICKRIIEKHGGKIWVESSGENKGSTFSFSLPLSKRNQQS